MDNKALITKLNRLADYCDVEMFEQKVGDNRQGVFYYETKADTYREVIRMLEGEK